MVLTSSYAPSSRGCSGGSLSARSTSRPQKPTRVADLCAKSHLCDDRAPGGEKGVNNGTESVSRCGPRGNCGSCVDRCCGSSCDLSGRKRAHRVSPVPERRPHPCCTVHG